MEEQEILKGLKATFKFDSFKSNLQQSAIQEICRSEYCISYFSTLMIQ